MREGRREPVLYSTHIYEKGSAMAGLKASRQDWRVCKSIFVADDDATANRYAKTREGPYGFYYWNLLTKRLARGGANIYKPDLSMPDSALTVEFLLDTLVIAGSVNSVVDQILKFREIVGDFGTLMYVGHDWADVPLARHSMALMAEKVMPAVNAAIGA